MKNKLGIIAFIAMIISSILGNAFSAQAAPDSTEERLAPAQAAAGQLEKESLSANTIQLVVATHGNPSNEVYSFYGVKQFAGGRPCLEKDPENPQAFIPRWLEFDHRDHCQIFNWNSLSLDTPMKNLGYQPMVRTVDNQLAILGINGFNHKDPIFTVGWAPKIASQQTDKQNLVLGVQLEPGWVPIEKTFAGKPVGRIAIRAMPSVTAALEE